MTFEIYCGLYNEEWLIPKMVQWYREKLKGHEVEFIIYDNESTDDTAQIARDLGCLVYPHITGGEMREDEGLKLVNQAWKLSTADYAIVICTDEFIDIDPNQLRGCTVVKCFGYNMVGDGSVGIMDMVEGVRAEAQDKCCIFSPKDIRGMNYGPGMHSCSPTGNVIWNNYRPMMYHMNMISKEWMVFRYRRGRERLSDYNKKQGYGAHYDENDQAVEQLWEHAWGLREQVRII